MPRPGDIVYFVLNVGPSAGSVRPAMVVGGDGRSLNLQVFTDGTKSRGDGLPNVFWKQNSVEGNGEPGTWRIRQ